MTLEREFSRGRTAIGGGVLVILALVAVAFVLFVFGGWYTVAPGEQVVLTRNSAIIGHAGNGLHFKIPIIDGANAISIQPQKASYGDKDQNAAGHIEGYSFDQQPAGLVFSVNFHITDVDTLYTNFRDIETVQTKIIDPKVLEIVKNVFGRYEAAAAIQKRLELNGDITKALRLALAGQAFYIDSVQVEDISFSDKYERAVEERMEATVHQQQALADKAKRMTNADADAYERKTKAAALAFATTVQGDAEAHAVEVKGKALHDNPDVVALVLANKWNGTLPTTMPPGGTVPFLDLKTH